MTSRMARRVGGSAAVVIALVVVFGVFQDRDTTRTIKLEDRNGRCDVVDKKDARVKAEKFMIWKIDNDCTDQNMQVSVGNFRIIHGPSAPDTCEAATEGTAEWPFQETTDLSKRQHKTQIKLKVKKGTDLPGTGDLDYSYDVCLGDKGERKFDPRLVIER